MCAYSFTVFTSVFQLLPTAPYRMLELGGSTAVAGLFLGFLTYSSAFSAPFTGHVADRIGHRRVLITVSLHPRRVHRELRVHRQPGGHARRRDRARVRLVGAAGRVERLHDVHGAGVAARRGAELLGPDVRARDRRRAGARILGLQARLDGALPRADGAQSDDGDDRLAAAGRSRDRRPRTSRIPRTRRRTAASSGACWACRSASRWSRSATAA